MPKCVVLLSGGLDSATVLAIAKDLGFQPHALTVLYGQRHSVEVEASKKVARALGAVEHKFVEVNLNVMMLNIKGTEHAIFFYILNHSRESEN